MYLPPGYSIGYNGQIYAADGRGPYTADDIGFFLGRRFRTYREFSTPLGSVLPAASRIIIRATLGVNTLLSSIGMDLDNGQVRVTSWVGGVITGAFVSTLPVRPVNGMAGTPPYPSQNLLEATAVGLIGAVNITGGTQLDVLRLKVANATATAVSAGEEQDSERGLAPGVVYIMIESIGPGDAEGIFRARWEEVPNG